ncbi:hypothetical protein CVV26_01455 [Candidatus Kuenenbacteria bacterium HGW-Kuenenbacteria-1]|uniref:Uncharacterized protein n=1 Tax=Candidatus Kuenenbacteria bacterium HGW-Kuenenbacteria-1 TaxID=2013812 RepID=A0A2N1UNQ1_9BACT|nr:MAG: hypothetical protein CVV26_01455 [Candidatus Kuenenbacteria bacterium HGW-Kuenenbacteria-1]
MKIFVKAKPMAKKNEVKKVDENNFIVSTTKLIEKGKANKAIIKLLAKYFNVSQSSIKIFSGFVSKNKIIEILF